VTLVLHDGTEVVCDELLVAVGTQAPHRRRRHGSRGGAHTLRYYERIGLVEVVRDAAGHRVYDRAALGRVVFVTRLRLSDMPIERIRCYLDLVKLGDGTAPERLALMQAHRTTIVRRLQELQTALAVIDYKITTYGGHCGS
jgi:DNA-binding transcriptional MerR regulator